MSQVTLVGQGGSRFVFDLPLRPPFDDQVAKGVLQPLTPEDRELLAIPEEQPEPEEDKTPTVDDILSQVGDDPDKATAALEAEQGRENPRSTLISALEKIAAD